MISSTIGSSVIVPLTADFKTGNIPDNQMYSRLIASLPVTITRRETFYPMFLQIMDMMIMNYMISTDMGFQLICPVQIDI